MGITMSEKLITEMSAEEFAEGIETFITRETRRVGEVDALPLFTVRQSSEAQHKPTNLSQGAKGWPGCPDVLAP